VRNYPITLRISLLVAIAILSGLAIFGVQIWNLRQAIYAERERKVHDMVDGALQLIGTYDDEVKAGHLTLDQAQDTVMKIIRSMRWGNGEYYGIHRFDGVTLVTGNPAFEGHYRMDVKDPNGIRYVAEMIATAQKGGGMVRYLQTRGTGASGVPLPKMTYSAPYMPWNWAVVTGVYVDDIDDTLRHQFMWIGGVGGLVLLVTGLLAILIAKSVTGPVLGLVEAITSIDPNRPADWPCPPPRRDELGKIVSSLDALMHAFQNVLEQHDKAKDENARLGAELDVSRRMQHMLLPSKEELSALDGLEIAAFMEPASEVGGDYYDILPHGNGVRIGIGDVTGHGLESGMIMLMTQSAIRTLLSSRCNSLASELSIINTTIYENVKRMGCGKNLSSALFEYKPSVTRDSMETASVKGCLNVSGQHESVIIARHDGRLEAVDTDGLGFPIGLVENVADFVNDLTLSLYRGDVVVLYTDGITEAASEDGRLYGLERLAEVALNSRALSAEAIKEAIVSDVKRHMGKAVLYDDLTLIVLKQL